MSAEATGMQTAHSTMTMTSASVNAWSPFTNQGQPIFTQPSTSGRNDNTITTTASHPIMSMEAHNGQRQTMGVKAINMSQQRVNQSVKHTSKGHNSIETETASDEQKQLTAEELEEEKDKRHRQDQPPSHNTTTETSDNSNMQYNQQTKMMQMLTNMNKKLEKLTDIQNDIRIIKTSKSIMKEEIAVMQQDIEDNQEAIELQNKNLQVYQDKVGVMSGLMTRYEQQISTFNKRCNFLENR